MGYAKILPPEKSPTDPVSQPAAPKRRQGRPPDDRFPHPVGDLQANHCRNVNCENFGVPAEPGAVPQGKPKGRAFAKAFLPTSEASCSNTEAYAARNAGSNAWSDQWVCRGVARSGLFNADQIALYARM